MPPVRLPCTLKTLGQTQEPLEKLYFTVGLGTFGDHVVVAGVYGWRERSLGRASQPGVTMAPPKKEEGNFKNG